jgi:ABC-type antimicrobial peptide transport system permease subunit
MIDRLILFPGLVVYSNLNTSDNLIELVEDYGKLNDRTWETPRNSPESYKLEHISFVALDKENDFAGSVLDKEITDIKKSVEDYCKIYEVNFNPKDSTHYDCLRYAVDQKFERHHDDDGDFKSRISLVYYPNDNYEGGDLYFHHLNIQIKPTANSLVIFPSSYLFSHSTFPVVSGTKYSITRFLS